MENFIAYNPTQLHFGKGVVNTMAEHLRPFEKKVLFIVRKRFCIKERQLSRHIRAIKESEC